MMSVVFKTNAVGAALISGAATAQVADKVTCQLGWLPQATRC